MSTADDTYFTYYEPFDPQSFDKAIDDLARYAADEGPFDGVMAFSHGCSVAAAYILEQQRWQTQQDPGAVGQALPLKCAVFFCGRLPYTDAGPAKHARSSGKIRLPTAHIMGANDRVEPGAGLELTGICNCDNRFVFEHAGGHEVPGSRDKDALIDTVHTINRMLKQVEQGRC